LVYKNVNAAIYSLKKCAAAHSLLAKTERGVLEKLLVVPLTVNAASRNGRRRWGIASK
jgi:hypothetical protein